MVKTSPLGFEVQITSFYIMINGVSVPSRSYCKSGGPEAEIPKRGADVINAISHASVFPAMAC